MDYSFLIEYLRQKQYLTDLEKDILDTWNELPTTVSRHIEQMTEFDIRYNLENQFAALAAKEGWQKYGQ